MAQTADFEFAVLSEARNYRALLLRTFEPYLRGNVLEVGAGIGQVTADLRRMPAIRRLTSIEPDPAFCDRLRTQFPQHDLIEGTVQDLQRAPDWDATLSVNVLEHIEQDEKELEYYHRLLKRNRGALCLLVPARPEIYAQIDEDFGHFRRYTRPALQEKLERAGFELLDIRYYNFAGYFLWWLNFWLLKKRSFEIGKVRMFDRAIFPLVHCIESRVCPPPVGQSLIAIARAR